MPCSPEQLAANRKNAALSSGPKTTEGKETSRRNGLKHGLTGAGVVSLDEVDAEVQSRADRFRRDLKPADSTASVMVFRLAVMAVRMERCVYYETATLSAMAREVLNDPTIETETELRQALALARFDHSPESAAVRRYEAASSREFFKTLHALRDHEPGDNQPLPLPMPPTRPPVPHEPARVTPTPVARTASAELGSSCKSVPLPIPRELKPYTIVELSPVDELTRSHASRTQAVPERSTVGNPLNFAIGKPPG